MNCKQTLTEISDFLDGDLDPGLVEAIEKHLSACPDCKVVVDTTKKTIELFCGSEPMPLPQDVGERLQKVLDSKLKPPS